MASVSIYLTSYSLRKYDVVPCSSLGTFKATCSSLGTFKATNFFGCRLPVKPPLSVAARNTTRLRPEPYISASTHTFDVVVIGAGIIGLTVARQFLAGSDLSVAVVDKAVPCSGATGAGQGYLWMVHKSPESDTWDLAMRSRRLWEMFAETVRDQGLDPFQALGWKKNGSLFVGQTHEESEMLKRRVKRLCEAGLRAEYLSSFDLHSEEPELWVGEEGGAAFVPDDCQLDAMCSVAIIEKANRQYASKGRYAEFYHDPVTRLLRSSGSGEVQGVQTSKNVLYSEKAIVVAAGCWSGSLVHDLFRELDVVLEVPVKPRKGHLLVLENFGFLKLNHGLMEMGYVDHLNGKHSETSASGPADQAKNLSVSMAATMDTRGGLVLGSSREFSGFNTEVDDSVINCILKRNGEFFPKLKELSLSDITKGRKVRIGLRPYMPDGRPVIGPVPCLPNVFFATGHEGSGLSLAMGTAEMIADMVLGNPRTVDDAAFAVQGRCC